MKPSILKIYRYIKLNNVTYDMSKIKPIDEILFIDYCKLNGRNYGFFNKLNHILSFWFYGDFNDDTINAYNYFSYRHNLKINRKQKVVLLSCIKD